MADYKDLDFKVIKLGKQIVRMCTEGGSWLWRSGRTARTASATSITFVPGCFNTSRVMER